MIRFEWVATAVSLRFVAAPESPVRLVDIGAGPSGGAFEAAAYDRAHQPLVEVMTPRFGNNNGSTALRHSGTRLGAALRYAGHQSMTRDGVETLVVDQLDPESGLRARSTFEARPGVPAVRTSTTVSLVAGAEPLTLWAVTAWSTGAVVSEEVNALDVWRAESGWMAEHRWARVPLRGAGLVATRPRSPGETAGSAIAVASSSSWSAGAHVPAGAVQNRRTGRTLAWQVEHNGAWLWEVGERPWWGWAMSPLVASEEAAGPPTEDRGRDGAYVAVLGPTDTRHAWSLTLTEDSSFTTVPVSFAVADSLDDAFGRLTAQRRATRREHPQNVTLPVVFNDYMDTLEGDPTEAKLLPLIDAAAAVGCEYFCIDAGWYDDTAGWWASVGDWTPSTVRFPRGIGFVLDRIRHHGLVPGLWLEPEVVGVRSRAAGTLPDEAFLQRSGVRIRERDRYFLDLRSPQARAHLDQTVDRLVTDLGIGYLKLDYNVTPGPGTDVDAESVGEGLRRHQAALLEWLGGVLDRHPDLVLENCGSGALRSDFAMLGQLQLQSTSDQQDPLLYPAIAIGSVVHILPEQAAQWAYPQAGMSDEEIAFTMCTGLAGRLYQSGLLDRMDPDQLALVAAGVAAHKLTRHAIARSTPRFPTGLPSWDQAWLSVAFDAGPETYVLVWRQSHAPRAGRLELPHLGGAELAIEQVYPPTDRLPRWDLRRTEGGLLVEVAGDAAAARMYRITSVSPSPTAG
ncbi:glycoside hydrolase family 36 protein [uncultured Friedmanniella sp.]|uniref:glycoside hydrolase family 36 protein n=1 Tax=uncultured Friedmanniella sp. TaxID=335381 RepID=UPI0035CC7EAD